MLSSYAKREWLVVLAIGMMVSITLLPTSWWWLSPIVFLIMLAVLSFFRDPDRVMPTQRGIMVSPADGRVSSVHQVDHYEPLGEPAVCIRIFLSLLDVHVHRSPCHAVVDSVTHTPGKHLNVLNPVSAEENEFILVRLVHPVSRRPLVTVRLVAGMIARTIVCAAEVGDTVQRGHRMGIIKLGSTAELYIPHSLQPQVLVKEGDKVRGAITVLANVSSPPRDEKATIFDGKTDATTDDGETEDGADENEAPAPDNGDGKSASNEPDAATI